MSTSSNGTPTPAPALPTVPRQVQAVRYQGRRPSPHEAIVWVSRPGLVTRLRLRDDLYSRSHGHEWGYSGAGPAQLAFDLLMDFFGDEALASRYLTAFDHALSCKTHHDGEWDLTGADILTLLEQINAEKGWGPIEPTPRADDLHHG